MISSQKMLFLLIVQLCLAPSSAFFVSPNGSRTRSHSSLHHEPRIPSKVALQAISFKLSTPTQAESVALGIREWPQQLKSGSWSESVNDGQSLTRYVLEGSGTVQITSSDGDEKSLPVNVGSLLEVTGPSSLKWNVKTPEMIILTPGYEEGGKLVAAAAALILLTVALISGAL